MGFLDTRIGKKLINKDEKTSASTAMAVLIGGSAAFGGILYGYDTGTISGILGMKYVLEHFPDNKESFTSAEHSLIVSILSVGTFFGSLAAALVSDRFGRRWTILVGTFLFFNVGIILQCAATSIPLLCAGRAVAGFGVGLISSIVPLYQAETVPKWIRGALVSCYQWAITIGILLANCVNQGSHARNDSGSYRIPIAIQLLWSLILGGAFIFLPDTPRFYITKDNTDKALRSLSIIRKLPVDHPEIVQEYNEIKANHEFELSFGASTWLDCFSRSNSQLKRLFTGVALQAFQQLTGINFIFYYGTSFFAASGIKNPFVVQLATSIVNVGMTVPGIFLVEIWGRRQLLLVGAACMCISEFIVAIVGVATPASSVAPNQVMVAFTCLFIASFAASWGSVAWVVCSEIFSLRVRQKSVAMSVASNWLWNFGIGYATPYMVDSGPGNADLKTNVFFIWGGCNLLCFLFTWFFIYETKNLTLEEVDELYENVPNAWKSAGFIPTSRHFDADGAYTPIEKAGVDNVESAGDSV